MWIADSKRTNDALTRLQTDWMLWQLVPIGVGMKIGGHQEKMLLKVSLSTGLYLHVNVDNLPIVMIQKRRRTSYMSIIGLQRVEVDVSIAMRGTTKTSNSR